MKIVDFSQSNSIINLYMSELRDKNYQKNRLLFRHNITRIGEMMAYELSKTLEYKTKTITTPLGTVDIPLPKDDMVIATVLRAGLPFHEGFLNVFDKADNGFVSAFRMYINREHTEVGIHTEYIADGQAQEDTPLLRHCCTRRTGGGEGGIARGQPDLVRRHRPRHERTEVHRTWLRRLRRPLLR